MSTANSTKATNPPISGQYMAVKIYEPGRTRGDPRGDRRSGGSDPQAWRATCSLGEGNAQATCWRRS